MAERKQENKLEEKYEKVLEELDRVVNKIDEIDKRLKKIENKDKPKNASNVFNAKVTLNGLKTFFNHSAQKGRVLYSFSIYCNIFLVSKSLTGFNFSKENIPDGLASFINPIPVVANGSIATTIPFSRIVSSRLS